MPVTNVKGDWSGGDLYLKDASGNTVAQIDGTNRAVVIPSGSALTIAGQTVDETTLNAVANTVISQRIRTTTANVNAGAELLAAVAGYKYRIVDLAAIAIGGNAAVVTTVDILGTQGTSSVKLVAFAQASLTRSTVLHAGESGAAVLADGASFTACDTETAITIGITGSAMTTATNIDVIISYVLEAA